MRSKYFGFLPLWVLVFWLTPVCAEGPADIQQKILDLQNKSMQDIQQQLEIADPDSAKDLAAPQAPGVAVVPDPAPVPGIETLDAMPTNMPKLNMSPADIQAFMDNPLIQKFLGLMNDPEFFPNINRMKDNKNIKQLLLFQLGFFVFITVWRIWRHSKSQSFFGRLWVSAYCMSAFWAGSLYYIPGYVLGEPYKKIVQLFWKTFTQ